MTLNDLQHLLPYTWTCKLKLTDHIDTNPSYILSNVEDILSHTWDRPLWTVTFSALRITKEVFDE